ncbi:Uncharacterised protein [Streptococcus pneumoniae]|nr:Uncharacterised protein [Streptococcus pneumoniae]CJT14547.1 Uncharacterised protein [Streptococcus pneumoniae]
MVFRLGVNNWGIYNYIFRHTIINFVAGRNLLTHPFTIIIDSIAIYTCIDR